LLRLAALTLADNVFMLPPAKIVDQGLIAVQNKHLRILKMDSLRELVSHHGCRS
jgi:hypothetical protein